MNARANSTQRKSLPRKNKSRKKASRVPSLRHHKATGQGYVVLNNRAIYLGKFGQPNTSQKYHQVIAEWIASGRQLRVDPEHITIKELIAHFWIHVQECHCRSDGKLSSEGRSFKLALKPLKDLYSLMVAKEFGPRCLRAVREEMIRKGWSRPYINKSINRIRHVFKWAVSHELVASSVLHGLQTLPGLRQGRTGAREPEAVRPAPQDQIDAIEPFVSRQVWALVQLQLLTGARAGELVIMRHCDVDRGGRIWVYTPTQHKTAHYGYERKIYVGPQGQRVLAPFLLRSPEVYCFSPAEAETQRRMEAHTKRETLLSCGNKPGTNCKEKPSRKPGESYTVDSYRRAITRGCDWAFPLPEPLAKREGETNAQWQKRLTKEQKEEVKAWRKAHRWHPHQLRHNAATNLRKEFGLEAARVILGHRSAAITEVYAELDHQKAVEAMLKIG